jgi:hypothetical protein
MTAYTPAELMQEFQRQRAEMTGAQFFRQTGLQRMREMWCAARLAGGLEHHFGPCSVLIDDVDDQRSGDFSISFDGGHTHKFEQTEIQKKGRRRGDEYRELEPGSMWLEPLVETEEAMEQIQRGIEAKAQKLYSDQSALQLLVYVNLSTQDLDAAKIHQRCARACDGFAGVWLMTGELFACIHQTLESNLDFQWRQLSPPV